MATQRAQQKARTRKRVLAAARACLETEGYEATTIARVALRAKVATGTVMAHFSDKAALVAAAFHDTIEQVVQEAIATAPPKGTCVERLLHVSDGLYTFYAGDRALSAALVRDATFSPANTPREALDAQLHRFLGWVGEELAAGQGRGELKADLSLEIAVLGYWADYYVVLLMGVVGGAPPAQQRTTLEALLSMRLS